ncbi:unnamed protein product, partial [Schistosoma mattheei]
QRNEENECGGDSSGLTNDDYYHGLSITVRYNQARLHEAQGRSDLAEEIYKSILLRHPSYIECYLRLGCIARDRGQIRDASIWFKEALDVDQDNPDAWTLIGLLHLNKNEVEQAQKKFDRIIRQPAYRADAFARICLGNIWLTTLHHPIKDKDKRKRHQILIILRFDCKLTDIMLKIFEILAREQLLCHIMKLFSSMPTRE